MEKLNKLLKKLSRKERGAIERLVERIARRDLAGLDCKKLKGLGNVFRVRRGNVRIIFELSGTRKVNILTIERRSEKTYRF